MDEPLGPSPETLRGLKGMLPTFKKGLAEAKLFGKGRPVATAKARKICPVCDRLHDKIITHNDVLLTKENCEFCAKNLKAGYIALVAGDMYAFVKSERLKDLAGEMITISHSSMEKIQKQFQAEWKQKETDKE